MLDSNSLSNDYPNTFLGQTGIGYKICDRLGAGSASVVFRCHTVGRLRDDGIMIPMEEEYYAVKIIDVKSIYLTPDYNEKKTRLLEEAMILQKLRHPNIVSLVDFSDSGDCFYLVMDLVQGGELFYKIVESGALTESSTRYILKQIVEALLYMHQKEIIHRDLKPENILIDKTFPGNYFNIKVADFGVAKFLKHGYTQARTLVGTPQYWAPEVITASKRGDSYGPEADLWSLGVLFYVMLGGAFPFDERKGNLEQLIKTGNYHFRYPRFKRVSDEAKNLIKRLLTVNPKERMTLIELKEDPWMQIVSIDEPNISFIDQKMFDNSNKQEIVLFNQIEEDKSLVKTPNSKSNNKFNTIRIVKSSKTSSIMDINGLLDLQLSIAYKLYGIYIAFRHNSSMCRLIQQHIHKWRILQQQSCLAIGKFKQTCESVLDELPDFLLAVNTNEPKLAIELLSHVKQLVDITQNDVELIQNGYNDFLFELSNFVESIRDIKRITESNNINGLSSNIAFKNDDGNFKEEINNEMNFNIKSNETTTQNSFDPSIFIGYNSARDKVIRRITDLFSNAEINNLLNPLESQNFKDTSKLNQDEQTNQNQDEYEDFNKEEFSNQHFDSNLQIKQINLKENSQVEKKESSYITTSLSSTRDLLLDFLFLPASICNVPPSGVESVLQESVDFGLPNLTSFEGTSYSLDEERIERNSSINSISSNNRLSKSNETFTASISTSLKNKTNSNFNNSDQISNLSNSNPFQQDQIKRNENQLKISYVLVRVLAQLRMIESILGRCVAFWGNMNIMIEKILQLRQHAERLLGFTENPILRTRFDERVESYKEFWQELRDICDSYIQSAQSRQLGLENQVHELLDTASKVDTVMNMNIT